MNTINKLLLLGLLVLAGVASAMVLRHQHAQAGSLATSPTTRAASGTPVAATPRRPRPVPKTPAQQETADPATPTPSPTPIATPSGPATEIETLRAAIFGSDTGKRDDALAALGALLAQGKGGELLSELIASNNKELGEKTASLLPKVPEGARIPYVSQALDAKDPEFRLSMLSQVHDMASPEINDLLAKGMKDTDPSVQDEVADLFIYFEHESTLYQAAAEGLTNQNETIREYARNYLEDNRTAESIACLIEALKSKFPEVAPKAGNTLRAFTGAPISTNSNEDWAKWWAENKDQWEKQNAGK